MFWNRLFGKKKNKKKDDSQYGYAPLRENREFDPVSTMAENARYGAKETPESKRHVVELCEQMIEASRDLEEVKEEYQELSSHLADLELLEGLSESQRKPIAETAAKIENLDVARKEFMKAEKQLSDAQFAQMQEEENDIPKVVQRFRSNEAYLDVINKDMRLLEGEKMEWTIHKQEMQKELKRIRKLSFIFFALFATLAVFILLYHYAYGRDTQLALMVVAFLATICGGYLILKFQDCQKEVKKADINRNQAITLENHVKIKYVNMKNAVDYTCEKYHVTNSHELTYIYEKYQTAVKEKEKFRQNSDDLSYYIESLIRQLEGYGLTDAKIWIHYTKALVNRKEMVELKHELLQRRKKLRENMEYSKESIDSLRKEIIVCARSASSLRVQVQEILDRVDRLTRS